MTVQLLAIVAHPDDAELLCGGTLARAAEQGHAVGILDLSRGELGSTGTPDLRAREARAAADILGVSQRSSADLPDGNLQDSIEARRVVIKWIRQLEPRVVITHWPEARHPDHAAAATLARSACFLAGLKNYDAPGKPHRPHKLLYSLTYQETTTKPSFVVDITGQIEKKLAAIFAFDSQFTGKTAMGDVVGGGERSFREQILAHHAQYGSLIRRPYGEPFWTRETMAVDDVVTAGVSSF
ncbi:MAG: bacillithiol biosynthesis deacetylase BshB1 [Gemmatimonadota bacterium]